MRLLRGVLLIVVVTGWAASVFSQTTGQLAGLVQDAKGGLLVGAKITVTNDGTGLVQTTQSGSSGEYRIPDLVAGQYTLVAEVAGFAHLEVKALQIEVGETRTLNLSLEVASAQATVAVESGQVALDTQTTHLGEVIQRDQVETLPLNGRNFAQLALLNAGVAAAGGGGGQQGGEGGSSGYSSNGQRSSSNNFLVDGIDNNDYQAGAVGQLPSVDSIQEFQVQTNNFSAQYGRNSGSVVNLITKSGTNKIHGSAYEFLRNDALDAENFFATPGLRAPELRLNQFGGTIGGPIRKDKTFFFGNYEGTRQVAGLLTITTVPTAAQKAGVFSNNNGGTVTVPVNPTSAALFQLFPASNVNVSGGNYVSSPNLTRTTDQYLAKLDHHLGSYDMLSGRYSYERSKVFYPIIPGQGVSDIPGFGENQDSTSHLFALSYSKVLSPNTVNEARFGFTRFTVFTVNELGPQAATYGFNTGYAPGAAMSLGNIPSILFSGGLVSGGGSYSNIGATGNNPDRVSQNILQFIDTFTHIAGRHSFAFGADIRNTRDNVYYALDFSGQLGFDGSANPEGIPNPLIDFAEGLPADSLQFVGDASRGWRTTSYDFFAQDTWRLTPHVTLNYGLRYELNTVLHDATGVATTWNPANYKQYLSPTVDQTNLAELELSGITPQSQGGLYAGDHNNFGPRVGLSWNPAIAPNTVLRVAYGVFYDTILGNIPANVSLNPPAMPDYYTADPSFPDSFGPSGFPVLTVTARNFMTPYSQAWNLDWQQGLGKNAVLDLAYVGTTGTKLPHFLQVDQDYNTASQLAALSPSVVNRLELLGIPPAVAQILASGPIADIPGIARNPYFGFAQIFQANTSVSSHYNALQAKLDVRSYHGLHLGADYTYSKSIDGGSAFFGSGANGTTIFPQNSYDPAADKGLSDFDIRNRFVANFIYTLPRFNRFNNGIGGLLVNGWETSGIVTAQSGQPFSVLTGVNESSSGLGTDRPNLVGNPNSGSHNVNKWFNTSAFVLNQPLQFGDAGRNIVTGPGYVDFDFSMLKNTPLGGDRSLQFRAEMFNIFNHPNFGLPNSTLTAPAFGALFETADVAQSNVGLGSGGPRLIQFALKFLF
jgi:Carboxypeptidase regulatory-like domain/TonB-dependent Receptor Plug Domain